jgi:hypothetical protein
VKYLKGKSLGPKASPTFSGIDLFCWDSLKDSESVITNHETCEGGLTESYESVITNQETYKSWYGGNRISIQTPIFWLQLKKSSIGGKRYLDYL